MKFGAAIPVMNEWRFMPAVVGQLLKVVDRVVVLRGTRTFSGTPAILTPVPLLHGGSRVEIVEAEWPSEHETRNFGMEALRDCDYVFTVDSDEIFSENALRVLKRAAELNKFKSLACRFKTYWKSIDYQIDPPEVLVATVLARSDVRFEHLRMFSGEQVAFNQYAMHHLSYVRDDDEVQRKIRSYGHAEEVISDWYERVWLGWDQDPLMEDLHPTHPSALKRAVPSDLTDREALRSILLEHGVIDVPGGLANRPLTFEEIKRFASKEPPL